MAMLRPVKFCWYFKLFSHGNMTSKPALSAASRRSPFLSSSQLNCDVRVRE